MRRIVTFVLVLILMFSANGITEVARSPMQTYQDMIKSLDYESLLTLSNAVNTELLSRQDAQPLVLSTGLYLVGSDITPGIYYFTSTEPNRVAKGDIYTSKFTYENRNVNEGRGPAGYLCNIFVSTPNTQRIILEKDNFIEVYTTVVLCADKESAENYFTYAPPEGTYVPAGIYTVGIDIPEGMYRFYSATGYEAEIEIFERGKRIERLTPGFDYETARLLSNYEIEIADDIIMTKQPSLSFE